MDQWTIILASIVLLIAIIATVMTLKVMVNQSKAKDEQDHSVEKRVRDHNILLNPVFLVYIIAGIGSIIYIVYWMVQT
ncbi:hypothetical protein [Jeotgalibacillus marinus]|uniref:Short-chain dehydrogenase n=1 Tax=Jeotgalibacillus marinus TaxID=86667 RepID=A0ABV3Q320_9BACL